MSDRPIDEPPTTVPADTVVIVDGCFLQRPELAPYWDYRIFVNTSFETARARGIQRDAEFFGDSQRAKELYDVRYHPACRVYLESVQPMRTTDLVVDNDDIDRPGIRTPSRVGPNRVGSTERAGPGRAPGSAPIGAGQLPRSSCQRRTTGRRRAREAVVGF